MLSLRDLAKVHPTLANGALFLASMLVVLVLAEAGYRYYLQNRTLLTFNVTNKPLYQYSASTGYDYIPNTKAVCIYMLNGNIFTYDSISVGPYGNLGDGVQSWTDEDFKILAFGDSFTANPYKYFSWTDHVAEPLGSTLGRSVRVMNLARDGYGVLQMMRLANETLKKVPADLVVIAFIVDDLDRARVWRSKLVINGQERTLLSLEKGPLTSTTYQVTPTSDVVLVYPPITAEWCEDQVTSRRKDDQILAGLKKYCQTLVAENFTEGFSSLGTSFLFNRLLHGDPFQSVRTLPRMARIDFQDYRQDEEFVEDVRSLMNQPVPVLMIMLPGYPELKEGRFILTNQRKSLLESLQHLTGGKVTSAFDYLDHPMPDVEDMFFVPADLHPKKLGAQRYAQAIVKAIHAQLALKASPPALCSIASHPVGQ